MDAPESPTGTLGNTVAMNMIPTTNWGMSPEQKQINECENVFSTTVTASVDIFCSRGATGWE